MKHPFGYMNLYNYCYIPKIWINVYSSRVIRRGSLTYR